MDTWSGHSLRQRSPAGDAAQACRASRRRRDGVRRQEMRGQLRERVSARCRPGARRSEF